MLEGYLIYNDPHVGHVKYKVYAKDSFTDMKLRFETDVEHGFDNLGKAELVYDKAINEETGEVYNPYEGENLPNNRRLDIGKESKFKTNLTNREFAVKVSAIIRYAQMEGRRLHVTEEVRDSDSDYITSRTIQIDNPGIKCTIRYDYGVITDIRLQSAHVALLLESTPEMPTDKALFKDLKKKDNFGNILSITPIINLGFSFSEEVLGFPYTPIVVTKEVNVFGMYDTLEEVSRNNPDKNLEWLKKKNYIIVDESNMEAILKEFLEYDGYIAFDTETSGLKITYKSRIGEGDYLVGVVLCKEPGKAYYFPLQHKRIDNLCGGDHYLFMEKYMRPILERKKIVTHNIQYDWKVAYIYDIVVNCVYDTYIMFAVTKGYEIKGFPKGLKELARMFFQMDMLDITDFLTVDSLNDTDLNFSDLSYEVVKAYGPADGDATLSLMYYCEAEGYLDKYDARKVFDLEITFAIASSYSEFWGYNVKTKEIPQLREDISAGMKTYSELMFKEAGYDFNPNSPVQLKKVMYEELKITPINEKMSTDKDTLRELLDKINDDGSLKYPFAQNLKKYRENEGIHKNFLKRLHEFASEDGVIFPNVNPFGTTTGRSSVSAPNYQSYNDAVKKRIVARSGFIMVDCDFSQIEYRVLASMARQLNLIEEFEDPDLDYHTYQASRMFGVPYALVSKDLRSQSKAINFGLPYGMGDGSLGFRIFGERNKKTQSDAARLRTLFFQGQERIQSFFDRVRSEGVTRKYTSTLYKRRRYYDTSKFDIGAIRRQAGNQVIQGTAADIYKDAVNRLFKRMIREGWLGKVLFNAFVHDELVMEVHESINLYYFTEAWREEFQVPVEGFCTLFAGLGFGESWYEAKKQDLPPQFIQEIVDAYDPSEPWHEDGKKFIDYTNSAFLEFKKRRVSDYIQAPENQGQILKPIINSLLVENVERIIDENINKAPEESRLSMVDRFNQIVGDPVFSLDRESGKATHGKLKLHDYLGVFCASENIDKNRIRIASPDEVIPDSSAEAASVAEEEFEFEDMTLSPNEMMNIHGVYLDEMNSRLYFVNMPMTFDGQLTNTSTYFFNKGLFTQGSGAYQVFFKEQGSNEAVGTTLYIGERGYQEMLNVYKLIMPKVGGFSPVM